MNIIWTTTASLLIRSGECTLAFDPFMEMPLDRRIDEPGRPELIPLYRSADRVYISHGHFDHICHFKYIYLDTDTPVYGTGEPVSSLLRDGLKSYQLHEIAPGYKETFGPFEIEAYRGRHCRFDFRVMKSTLTDRKTILNIGRLRGIQALRKLYKEKGEMLFYELRAEGKRLQIMGSMGMDPDTVYPEGADLLIMALQGRSDQDAYAVKFVERLRPKKIMLYHIDDSFPPISSEVDTLGFQINAKRAGYECLRPEKNKEYIL